MISSCGAIVLAAGASTRLGQPKQLIRIPGETLLERAVRVAREAGCDPIVTVLGASADEILASSQLDHAIPLINSEWQQGMGNSISFGIRRLQTIAPEISGAVLMVCDQPAVTSAHLRALAATGRLTASVYSGHRGVPAYFPAEMFAELKNLTGDTGARDLLSTAATVPLTDGELDIDTPGDLEDLRYRF